jgi:beta-glucanase (GH16 family)
VILVEEANFCESAPWQLVFEDEFEGNELNTDIWQTYFPYCDSGDACLASRTHGLPDELQIFRDENVRLTGIGILQMWLRKEPYISSWYGTPSTYSAGMIHSKIRFKRGRFECRCKVPKSRSHYIWPSIWLFGGPTAASEIDFMEILWTNSNMYHHTLHRYGYAGGYHASDADSHELGDLSGAFHTYRCDWDTWFIDFNVDDVLIHRSCRMIDLLGRPVSGCYAPAGIYLQNQAFPAQERELSVIAGLGLHSAPEVDAIGNGPPIPDLPALMEIDYVRVYRRQ